MNDLVEGRRDWPLYLWGDTGRGKTSAVLCLVNAYPDSLYYSAENVISIAFEREAWFWREGTDIELLAVDELGLRTGEPSEYERVAIERLADLRQFEPTIWVSNLRPKARGESPREPSILTRYGARVYSRICSGTPVELEGDDRRFQDDGGESQ